MAWRARARTRIFIKFDFSRASDYRAREKQFSVGVFERVSRYNRFTFVLMVF